MGADWQPRGAFIGAPPPAHPHHRLAPALRAVVERTCSCAGGGPGRGRAAPPPRGHRPPLPGGSRQLAALCAERGNPLFVNGRLDVALLVGAHLHLPAHGPTPEDVRPHLPPGRLVSVAVHDVAEARTAAGADLALVSPVFAPGSKPGDTRATLGPEGFLALAGGAAVPGPGRSGGITPER
ncbi:thiamine phosphate synthase, partial [Pyxidicoccus sp. 3LG]